MRRPGDVRTSQWRWLRAARRTRRRRRPRSRSLDRDRGGALKARAGSRPRRQVGARRQVAARRAPAGAAARRRPRSREPGHAPGGGRRGAVPDQRRARAARAAAGRARRRCRSAADLPQQRHGAPQYFSHVTPTARTCASASRAPATAASAAARWSPRRSAWAGHVRVAARARRRPHAQPRAQGDRPRPALPRHRRRSRARRAAGRHGQSGRDAVAELRPALTSRGAGYRRLVDGAQQVGPERRREDVGQVLAVLVDERAADDREAALLAAQKRVMSMTARARERSRRAATNAGSAAQRLAALDRAHAARVAARVPSRGARSRSPASRRAACRGSRRCA